MPTKDAVAWLACLLAAAMATQGMRSAATLAGLADELLEEYRARRGVGRAARAGGL